MITNKGLCPQCGGLSSVEKVEQEKKYKSIFRWRPAAAAPDDEEDVFVHLKGGSINFDYWISSERKNGGRWAIFGDQVLAWCLTPPDPSEFVLSKESCRKKFLGLVEGEGDHAGS